MSTFLPESDARRALDDLPGLTWQPMSRTDLVEVRALREACESYDHNPERTSLEELQEYLDSPRSRPEEDTLVGREDSGRVVAIAWSGCNRAITAQRTVWLGGAVHPDRRGEGIGGAVLRWELAHGDAWDQATREPDYGPLVMRMQVPVDQADVRDMAERHGLPVERYFYEMAQRLDGPVATEAPAGVEILQWDPERSDDVHRMINEAFLDHWGFVPTTPQMWQEAVNAHSFRPDWSVIAVDSGTNEVVGAALNAAYEQDWEPQGYTEGYTDELGVLASHRGRGVASALLRASMTRFAQAGLESAGLGVDTANPSGAVGLYEKLGYRTTHSTCLHQFSR